MKKVKKLLIICVILSLFMLGMGARLSNERPCFAVIDVGSGRVIAAQNPDEKKHIASLTKIATCITAIELLDLEEEVTIQKEWTGIEGSSIYLQSNEVYNVKELLYGLMLRSGNDAATALCEYAIQRKLPFLNTMNAIAKNAGAINTSFLNPHGLDEDGHYSSALDMAYLCAYCMKNETFASIVSSKRATIGRNEYAKELFNKNKLLSRYPYADGIKTGYTKKAGRCLASSAKKNGFRLVCVVLDCPSTYETTEKLFNEAYLKFERVLLQSKVEPACFYERNGKKLPCYTERDLFYPLSLDEREEISNKCIFTYNGDFPVKTGTEMGRIEFYLKNQLIFDEKIYNIIQ